MNDWTFELGNSWFLLTESLKITCARHGWFLYHFIKWREVGLFFAVLSKLTETTATCQNSLKLLSGVKFDLPKVTGWPSTLNGLKLAKWSVWKSIYLKHGEARNIKFGHQVNLTERVQIGGLDIITS